MTKRGFVTPLRVESVDAKNWKLLRSLKWVGSKDDTFTVHAGEVTDFATVPWWTQAILPRTGTWTKAAVLHDKMCSDLNYYYDLLTEYEEFVADGVSTSDLEVPLEPIFTSIDTDAIFRKNAREDGTDLFRSELLWFGVRSGSLINPARREDWMQTFPRYLLDLIAILAVLVGVVALIL